MEKDETERTGRENDCLHDENRIVITLRRPASAPSMSEILRKEQPEEMSVQEKDIICMLTDEEPPLPYPTHPLKLAYGPDAQEYEIPDEAREETLRLLYPFAECPKLDDVLYDIHQRDSFVARDYRVIRERNRNMLVSPFFPSTGGTVLDWLQDASELESTRKCRKRQ